MHVTQRYGRRSVIVNFTVSLILCLSLAAVKGLIYFYPFLSLHFYPYNISDIPSHLSGTSGVYGHLPPGTLKTGLQHLGSNLTDREFEYLLQKVGKSHDGKISLSEFDRIVNSAATNYDMQHSQALREKGREREASFHPLSLPSTSNPNSRYSKRHDPYDLTVTPCIPEYDRLSSGKTGRMDGAVWDSFRRLVHSRSASLPAAFNNIAHYFKPHDPTLTPCSSVNPPHEHFNTRQYNQDCRGENPGSGLGLGSGTGSCLRTPPLLDGMEIRSRARVRPLGSDGSSPADAASGQHSSRSSRINNSSSNNSSSSSSSSSSSNSNSNSINLSSSGSGQKVKQGSAGAARSTVCLPVSQIRNVLSDSGVQLGTEDAMRLSSLLVRRLSEFHPPQTQTQSKGEDMERDLEITLDQFYSIVGIPSDANCAKFNRGQSLLSLP
jgi:hypothetical protein